MYLQKIFTLFYFLLRNFFSLPSVKLFIRRSFTLGTILSLSIYGWVRLLFHDVPFEFLQETGMILNLLVAGWFLVGLCIGTFNLLMLAADHYSVKGKKDRQPVMVVFLAKFNRQPVAIPEYRVLTGDSNFAIDKTGRLRYRVITYTAAVKKEKDAATDISI